MTYEFRCRSCNRIQESTDRNSAILCVCGFVMTRDYRSIRPIKKAFTPHFNHAVGRYVESSHAFDEALKLGAEEQQTVYQRIDPGDGGLDPLGDTTSLETQARVHQDRGLSPPSTTTVIPLS